jgi:hypothetical protein
LRIRENELSNTSDNAAAELLERQKHADCRSRIGHRVTGTLGNRDNVQVVQVRPLWEHHYRVNVFIGADLLSAKILHSYFVHADADGNIIRSTPKIPGLADFN